MPRSSPLIEAIVEEGRKDRVVEFSCGEPMGADPDESHLMLRIHERVYYPDRWSLWKAQFVNLEHLFLATVPPEEVLAMIVKSMGFALDVEAERDIHDKDPESKES